MSIVSPAGSSARRRRTAVMTAVTVAAALITAGSIPAPVSAQIIPPPVTTTTAQLLQLAGGISPQKLRMIEEEGYICFMTFHRIPAGISWVCTPPLP